jgi:chaperonin cofactor prefoldin
MSHFKKMFSVFLLSGSCVATQAFAQSASSLDRRISKLESNDKSISNQVSNLNRAVIKLDSLFKEQATLLNSMQTKVGSQATRIQELETRIAELEKLAPKLAINMDDIVCDGTRANVDREYPISVTGRAKPPFKIAMYLWGYSPDLARDIMKTWTWNEATGFGVLRFPEKVLVPVLGSNGQSIADVQITDANGQMVSRNICFQVVPERDLELE